MSSFVFIKNVMFTILPEIFVVFTLVINNSSSSMNFFFKYYSIKPPHVSIAVKGMNICKKNLYAVFNVIGQNL